MVALVSAKIMPLSIAKNIWFFFVSLIFCIIATAAEWFRFTISYKNRFASFENFLNDKISDAELIEQSREHWSWLCVVTILRFLGYMFLIVGASVLIYSFW